VVIDELLAAGSFDRLARLPDGRLVVADIKTGQNEPQYPHGVTTQVAMYSRGTLYHPETGRGQSLQEMGVDQTTGLLIHLPAGQATCRLYLIDLEIGWALASVAARVRQMQKLKPLTEYTPGQ
jgi:RecB family exonuclease